ncbi:MAG: DUF3085 domain-containing protein, partial [Rhizobiales bacterium]|nr:DUF3085 domain-containing protein [Hyphomicrobiales bacterium]
PAHAPENLRRRKSRSSRRLPRPTAFPKTTHQIPAFFGFPIGSRVLCTAAGEIVLKFDITTVWRLVDHARNSKQSIASYKQRKPKPSLWLVGDSGVYLMSNGDPPIADTGRLIKKEDMARRLTAPAFGCDPEYNAFEDWWRLHNAIAQGNDFSITIPIGQFEDVLPECRSQIVVLIYEDKYRIVSDIDFEHI